jgi:hypothetical protein
LGEGGAPASRAARVTLSLAARHLAIRPAGAFVGINRSDERPAPRLLSAKTLPATAPAPERSYSQPTEKWRPTSAHKLGRWGNVELDGDAATKSDCPWQTLQDHFHRHARVVHRFKHVDADAVVAMWKTGTNEAGAKLSQFEREALIERYCELFRRWPEDAQDHLSTTANESTAE